MGPLILGILFLGFTVWQVRRGEADLLFWLGSVGVDITRAGNPILFWATITGQVVLALGSMAWGAFKLMHGT